MQADFLNAHERHWDDAERLFQAQRWANADHLYGMAAECGLKWMMLAFGMSLDKDRPESPEDRVHADGVWARYESYRSGHVQGTGYVVPASDPFYDWNVSDRYAHQSNFNQTRAQAHQAGAAVVCELIKKAQRDGLLK